MHTTTARVARRSLFALACATTTLPALADDLFSVTAVGNGVNTINASDSSILDLAEAVLETTGDFASLNGQDIVGTLNYADVPQAVRVSINAAETSATLEFPITGFSRNFTGTDADDLYDQIETFIEEDGLDAYSDFLEAINQSSVVAVLDGNPSATTALTARHTFGLYGRATAGPGFGTSDSPQGWVALTPTYSQLETGPFEGDLVGFDLAAGTYFNDWLGLAAGGSVQYVNLEDTEIAHVIAHLALPLRLLPDTGQTSGPRFNWQLTPFAVSGTGASVDAAAGGTFYGYGVASNLQISFADRVVLAWGAQVADYQGLTLEYDDFEFSTNIDQQIATTSLLATIYLDGPDGNLFLDFGATYTTFLDDAVIDEWVTPEVGLGLRTGNDSRLRLSYRPTFGTQDYETQSVTANLVWAF